MLYRIVFEKCQDRYRIHCVESDYIVDRAYTRIYARTRAMPLEKVERHISILKSVFPAKYFTGELVQVSKSYVANIKGYLDVLS